MTGTPPITGKTLPNAIVSNGRDIESSDAQGNYQLPFWGTHVYCVAPPGYSPFDGAAVALVGNQRHYDILPTPCKHPTGEFVFAQMADCHISQPGVAGTEGINISPERFELALRQVKAQANPDFVVLTGDQVDVGTTNEVLLMNEVLARVPLPAVQVNGNHEDQCTTTDRGKIPAVGPSGLAADEQIDDLYTHFGPKPFAFFWGRYLFICLDCMNLYSPDQHRWLRKLLAKVPASTPIIAAIHHPDKPLWCFPELFGRNLRMIISGHYHTHQTFRLGGLLHSSPSPALMVGNDGFPPNYRVYRIPADDSEPITYETLNTNTTAAFRKIMISRDAALCPTPGAGPLELIWSRPLDGATKSSAPVVVDNRVVVASHDLDVDPVGRLQVFDCDSGQPIWQQRLGDGFFGTPRVAPAGIPYACNKQIAHWQSNLSDEDPQLVPPTDYHIYLQSITGQVYCISLYTGNVLWQQSLGPPAGRACSEAVTICEDWVFAGDGNCFGAFHRHTGEQLWLWPVDPLARCGSFRTAGSAAGEGAVLVGDGYNEQGVVALDMLTGQQCWACGDRKHARFGNAVYADGYFYCFGPRDLLCIEAGPGKLRWSCPCSQWSYPEPLISNDVVFAATSDGNLLAVDRQTGRQLWKREFGPPLLPLASYTTYPGGQLAAPVVCGPHIVQGANDGNLYALGRHSGNITWQQHFGIPLTCTPVVVGDYLYLTTPDATVWKFKLPPSS